MMRLACAAVALGFCAGWLPAQNAPDGGGVQLVFAPPDLDGRYTLGIFDSAGKLVRTLFQGADQSAFQIGLNGLIATWDGKNDAGETCPAGTYAARGYVVGSVDVEGEAFHFNDWVADVDELREVRSARLTDDGYLIVLGQGRGSMLFRIALDGAVAWRSESWSVAGAGVGSKVLPSGASLMSSPSPLGGDPIGLACGRDAIVVIGARDVLVFDAWSGVLRDREQHLGRLLAVAATGMRACIADSTSLRWLTLPNLVADGVQPTPAGFELLDVDGLRVIGSELNGGRVWTLSGSDAVSFDIVDGGVVGLSAGADATCWAVVKRPEPGRGASTVRQYDASGAVLRELRSAPGEPEPEAVSASRREDMICLLERGAAGMRRVRVLRRDAVKPPEEVNGRVVADWQVVFERTLEPCARFGWVDGRLVADAGTASLPSEIEVHLLPNNLLKGPQRIRLRAAVRDGVAQLCTADGLPLVNVSGREGARRVALIPGGRAGSARVFVGSDAVVEEFSVRHINRMAAFDCGTFYWK
jgi:hypothetical protein